MAGVADHAREIRYSLVDVRGLCEKLGLLSGKNSFLRQAGGLILRCPWHADGTPSCSVRIAKDGTIACRCHACGATGDALSLVAVAHGLDVRRDFRRVLRAGAEIAGLWGIVEEIERGERMPQRPIVQAPAPSTEVDRDYPPVDEVAAFWASLAPVSDEPSVAAWLETRGLSPLDVDERGLARAIPAGHASPSWAVCRGGSWGVVGYRLVVPMYDSSGALRSVRAGRVIDGDGPKRRPPYGRKATGLVMADSFGRAMLQGINAPERVVVCEGEPDFLTWALRVHDRQMAVLGIVTGSWSPAMAVRIPKCARVAIRTDSDPAGDRYAAEIALSLKSRCLVRRAS